RRNAGVERVEEHRLWDTASGRRLQLELPGLAFVPRDSDHDLAAAGGARLAGELAGRVIARPDLVQVAVVGVRLTVGQRAERVDCQVRFDLEGNGVLPVG